MDNVVEVTVYSEKNQIVGQIVCAKVRLQNDEDSKVFKSRLSKYCRERLQSFKIPIKVKIVENELYSDRFKKMRDI